MGKIGITRNKGQNETTKKIGKIAAGLLSSPWFFSLLRSKIFLVLSWFCRLQ